MNLPVDCQTFGLIETKPHIYKILCMYIRWHFSSFSKWPIMCQLRCKL